MKYILHLLDSALVYEQNGLDKQAVEEWQEIIEAIDTLNEGKTIQYGIAVKKLAREHIQKLEK